MSNKALTGFFLLLIVATVCAAFSISGDDNFDLARQEIMLRKIGHEVLLQSGDHTSRVLPVKKLSDNTYKLQFTNEFTFQTDSLVAIVRRSLSKNNLASDYVVNVLNCSSNDVIFGYVIQHGEKNNIVACSGRPQLKSCYAITIQFRPHGLTSDQKEYVLAGMPLLALIGFIALRSGKPKMAVSQKAPAAIDSLKLGNITFDPGKRQLIIANSVIDLTAKETNILLIFAHSPNTVIERARLQKEIWEDEGVIVGRSLDMFISKLRKKLSADPLVQLTNIHGKGYKLEVEGIR